jgi:hypothetical protein
LGYLDPCTLVGLRSLFDEFGQHGVGQSTCDGHGVTKGDYHESKIQCTRGSRRVA